MRIVLDVIQALSGKIISMRAEHLIGLSRSIFDPLSFCCSVSLMNRSGKTFPTLNICPEVYLNYRSFIFGLSLNSALT